MSVTLPHPVVTGVVPGAAVLAPPPRSLPRAPADLVRDPLPLPGDWGAAQALDALAEARLALPFAVPEARVVSALTTVVLRCGDLAVKVYPPDTDAAHLARTAAALAGSRTALLPLAAPVVTSWGVVTVARWLDDARPLDWAATGRLLRRFHTEHADADVPAWQPLRRLVHQVEGLPDAAAQVLLDARAVLLAEVATLVPPLGVGTVHGDLSPANVLRAGRRPLLIDLDFAARAPLEYDLGGAARRLESGAIDAADYRSFCRAYGADVRGWDGRVVLDRVAALGGVAFRIWDDRRRGVTLDWLPTEVRRWRVPL